MFYFVLHPSISQQIAKVLSIKLQTNYFEYLAFALQRTKPKLENRSNYTGVPCVWKSMGEDKHHRTGLDS